MADHSVTTGAVFEAPEPALRITGLSKLFGGVPALKSVDLTLMPGKVHMLMGHNGSGKSTLMKILGGYYKPEAHASIEVQSVQLKLGHPTHSHQLGLRFVHQDLGLVESESVLDNLFMGISYPTRCATIRHRRATITAKEMLERVGLSLNPKLKVRELGRAQRTGIAIARAFNDADRYPARVLVLDEPTATLPANEVSDLLNIVRTASNQGVAVLYATHHLDEVFRIGEYLTILRDGAVVHSGTTRQLDRNDLVVKLTGSSHAAQAVGRSRATMARPECPMLEAVDITTNKIKRISFSVSRGEIVGFAGITGSGREELLRVVFGARQPVNGSVKVAGERIPPGRPDRAIRMGLTYLPDDRRAWGSFPTLSAAQNIAILNVDRLRRNLVVRRRLESALADEWIRRLDIRPAKPTLEFSRFSGGNQQKILMAKWLSTGPSVLLFDEPTQGVDVGAKADIHREIRRMADNGAAVLVGSTDLDELADLCTRVILIVDGTAEQELSGAELTSERLSAAFLGKDRSHHVR